MYLKSFVHWSLGNQNRCTDLLLIITKPSKRKWACADSSTLTYSITQLRKGLVVVFCRTRWQAFFSFLMHHSCNWMYLRIYIIFVVTCSSNLRISEFYPYFKLPSISHHVFCSLIVGCGIIYIYIYAVRVSILFISVYCFLLTKLQSLNVRVLIRNCLKHGPV